MLLPHQFNSVHQRKPLTKAQMLAALSAPPVKSSLPAKNTLDYTDTAGRRTIRLHSTDILTLSPNGAITIDTGGWNTHTTRARLNAFLPNGFRVHTSRGRLHLNNVPFLQHASVDLKGNIESDLPPAKDAKLAKHIDAYLAAWKKRGLPKAEDSLGDPWVFTQDKVAQSTMLGWAKSRYVFRKLLFLAHQYAGITDYGCALYLQDADRRGGKLSSFDLRRLRRYINACIGLA